MAYPNVLSEVTVLMKDLAGRGILVTSLDEYYERAGKSMRPTQRLT